MNASTRLIAVFFSTNVRALRRSMGVPSPSGAGMVSGTWNQTVRAKVREARMICDQSFRPSLYRSKLEVVR
jgi:hypothetical protein